MHKQLILLHNAIAAYFSGNAKALEATLKQFNIKVSDFHVVFYVDSIELNWILIFIHSWDHQIQRPDHGWSIDYEEIESWMDLVSIFHIISKLTKLIPLYKQNCI